ncbi:phosphoribosylaminoimidazolecarboxamide formyltransferase / IMP cyclohydrolase, partial [Candidatus Hakubella thermalkaliphila]
AGVTTVADAYQKAYAGDPLAAFGGVVACNTLVDLKVAKMINKTFIEAIIAPGYRSEALRELRKKEQIRALEMGSKRERGPRPRERKNVDGGLLVQDADVGMEAFENMEVVTKAKPSAREMEDLLFALRVAKHVRSNAIVLVEGLKTVGIGAGQMSRVDATKIAVMKAGDRSKGSVLASDAFFPFRDSVDWVAQHGIRAIIQPGGSVRDKEVIAAADEHGISIIFSGRRYFLNEFHFFPSLSGPSR